MTVVVMGTFRLPPSSGHAAREAMRAVQDETRAEPGCLGYAYAEDIAEPGLYHVSEQWESRAALDAHLATPHMARWRSEREAMGFHDRQMTVFEATGQEVL